MSEIFNKIDDLSLVNNKITSRDIKRINKTISEIDAEIVLNSDLNNEEKLILLNKFNETLNKLNKFNQKYLNSKQIRINITKGVLKDLISDLNSRQKDKQFSAEDAFVNLKITNIANQNMRSKDTRDYKNISNIVNNLKKYKGEPYFDELIENILIRNSFLLYNVFGDLEGTRFFTEDNLIKIFLKQNIYKGEKLVVELKRLSKLYGFDNLLINFFIKQGDIFLSNFDTYKTLLTKKDIDNILYGLDSGVIFGFYSSNLNIYFNYFANDLEKPFFKKFLINKFLKIPNTSNDGFIDNLILITKLSYYKEMIFGLIDVGNPYIYTSEFLLAIYNNKKTRLFFDEFIIKLYKSNNDILSNIFKEGDLSLEFTDYDNSNKMLSRVVSIIFLEKYGYNVSNKKTIYKRLY